MKKKSAKDIHYLSLTGVEGIEILEITDVLKIPRKNIVSCERNKKLAHELKRRFPKIKVVNKDIVDFLIKTNRKFDVINLDFCGTLTSKVLEAYRYISAKRILNDNGVIASTFLGARENKEVQEIMKSPFINTAYSNVGCAIMNNDGNKARKFMDEYNEIITSKKINRKGIALKIIQICLFGKRTLVELYPELQIDNTEDRWDELQDRLRKMVENDNRNSRGEILLLQESKERLVDKLLSGKTTIEQTKKRYEEADNLLLSWGGMIPTRTEGYKYISDNNSPMLNFIFNFKYIEKIYSHHTVWDWASFIQDLMQGKTLPEIIDIKTPEGDNTSKKITTKIKIETVISNSQKAKTFQTPEIMEFEKVTGKRAIWGGKETGAFKKWKKEMVVFEKVIGKRALWGGKETIAFKKWKKRKKKRSKKTSIPNHLSERTKRSIANMLKEEISTEEIMKEYDATKMQIAGIKAWMTRGKYNA